MAQMPLPAPVSLLMIDGGEVSEFYVHRIYCVGRNYADHAKEMGSDGREPPFFFCKPADAVVMATADKTLELPFPTRTDNLHFEGELVVALGAGGKHLNLQQAARCIAGYAVGLDMTKRDLQSTAKAAGKPWEIGKAFDQSAPIGPIVASDQVYRQGMLQLWQNGQLKQSSNVDQLIWAIDEVIVELSTYFELKAGDLIFTGTPAGVGAVKPGDTLRVSAQGVGEIEVKYLV